MKSGWNNYFLVSVLVAEQLAPWSISDAHGRRRRASSEKANLAKKKSVAVTDFYQLRAGTVYRYNTAFMIKKLGTHIKIWTVDMTVKESVLNHGE